MNFLAFYYKNNIKTLVNKLVSFLLGGNNE
nr:MAG TPA: hypothetical protein [Caudoviricetes sp.]